MLKENMTYMKYSLLAPKQLYFVSSGKLLIITYDKVVIINTYYDLYLVILDFLLVLISHMLQ